ncbi:unnamed protein product, partial [Rotaria sordida]
MSKSNYSSRSRDSHRSPSRSRHQSSRSERSPSRSYRPSSSGHSSSRIHGSQYSTFHVHSSDYEVILINRYMSMEVMDKVLNHINDCYQYSVDTESERSNHELSIIQFHTIPCTLPSQVLIIELSQLPNRESHLSHNEIYSWGDMNLELESANYLFAWPITSELINLQPHFPEPVVNVHHPGDQINNDDMAQDIIRDLDDDVNVELQIEEPTIDVIMNDDDGQVNSVNNHSVVVDGMNNPTEHHQQRIKKKRSLQAKQKKNRKRNNQLRLLRYKYYLTRSYYYRFKSRTVKEVLRYYGG